MKDTVQDKVFKEMVEEFNDQSEAAKLLSVKLKEKIVMFQTVHQISKMLEEEAKKYDESFGDTNFSDTVSDVWSEVEDRMYGLFEEQENISELEERANPVR
jgi:hypothetical protein